MNLIVSADKNWGIGKDGQLLFRARGDMNWFRRHTVGRTVIMGRRTLESLPDGGPLPERENIVLTRDPAYRREGVSVLHSREELFAFLAGHDEDNVMVIGGGEVYKQLMPYCMRALVTRWDAETAADTFLPDFDKLENWVLIDESPPREEDGVAYTFRTYLQRGPTPWKHSGK